jgi:hypothetical protein
MHTQFILQQQLPRSVLRAPDQTSKWLAGEHDAPDVVGRQRLLLRYSNNGSAYAAATRTFARFGRPRPDAATAVRSRVRTLYQSQKVTVAAMQMAEKKVWAHRS